ncbi:hypothetical protein BDP27DRAFT_1421475 [Rhodocollybia butyracea]|uniref:Uncharacterized protein n=1 Tax=Rhodocollybia butyracea TaxID=206335 RepID=A0A9P5PT02_9AGAR|nr:hypothetical protein BDP27DRAFT_1421475 [Rhodocollybia butyracea]
MSTVQCSRDFRISGYNPTRTWPMLWRNLSPYLHGTPEQELNHDLKACFNAIREGNFASSLSGATDNPVQLRKEQETHPIYNGFPFSATSPPITIFEPAFAQAKHELSNFNEINNDLSMTVLVGQFITVSNRIYDDENEWELAICGTLEMLLDVKLTQKVVMHKENSSMKATEADAANVVFVFETLMTNVKCLPVHVECKNLLGCSGDATLQSNLSLRMFQSATPFRSVLDLSHCPCLHVGVMGQHIQFAGSVYTDCFASQELTDIITLVGNPYYDDLVPCLSKIFTVIQKTMKALVKHYQELDPAAWRSVQCILPRSTYASPNSTLPLELHFEGRYRYPGIDTDKYS